MGLSRLRASCEQQQCLSEVLAGLDKPNHKWDLYTALRHVCVYTTKRAYGTLHRHCTAVGLLEARDFAATDFQACHANKALREAFFPMELLAPMLAVDVADARASIEADRRALIGAMVASGLDSLGPTADAMPFSADEDETMELALEGLNARLRGRFALAALRRAASRGPSPAYQTCVTALARSSARQMTISLSGCAAFDEQMALGLANALPGTLTHLSLTFREVSEEVGRTLALTVASRLKRQEIPGLVHLTLDSETISQPTAAALAAALPALRRLQSVGLGLPTPISSDAAQTLALCARASSFTFCAERLPLRAIALVKMGLTTADVTLVVASIANGSCGQVNSLDLSENNIDNYGLRALKQALEVRAENGFSTRTRHAHADAHGRFTGMGMGMVTWAWARHGHGHGRRRECQHGHGCAGGHAVAVRLGTPAWHSAPHPAPTRSTLRSHRLHAPLLAAPSLCLLFTHLTSISHRLASGRWVRRTGRRCTRSTSRTTR